MYCSTNFKTKKAFKQAVLDGKPIRVFQPNNIFGSEPPQSGKVTVEGPHYPAPHTWYAQCILKDGVVVQVK